MQKLNYYDFDAFTQVKSGVMCSKWSVTGFYYNRKILFYYGTPNKFLAFFFSGWQYNLTSDRAFVQPI